MIDDKALMNDFIDAYLMNACNDYKIAYRAKLNGKWHCSQMWGTAPKLAMIECEQFFFDWFDDDNTVRVLLRELRKQALIEGRGRKV